MNKINRKISDNIIRTIKLLYELSEGNILIFVELKQNYLKVLNKAFKETERKMLEELNLA